MEPNYCYQVPVVIGAGITGAAIAMLNPSVVVYDKGRNSGGRVSSKQGNDPSTFDFGATMFRDPMEVRWLGQETKYSILEIWKSESVSLQTKPIYSDAHFYPALGMSDLVSSMLGNVKPIQSHTLKKMERNDDHTWNLEFYNSATKQTDTICTHSVILTLPIPQILEIFHRSKEKSKLNRWIEFLNNYNDYRKTLVSYFYWDKWKPEWKSLSLDPDAKIPINTNLEPGSDWEYQSWESLKYPKEFHTGSSYNFV